MPIENDFLPFAVGGSANVTSQSAYAANATLTQGGFQSGIVNSADLNKVWRQSSIMSAVLAQFIVARTGATAIDDGTTATLLANLQLSSAAVNGDATKTFSVAPATAPQHAAQFSQTTGRLLNVQVFKTHGTFTYTKTPGTTAAYAECHGSGASGGGTPTTGASQCGVGGPGGSGAYASAWFSTGIPSGTTITIGQAGAPVNGSGNNGGSSSIGSLMTCPGGRTGTTAGPSAPPIVTGGGSGATGPATVTGGTAIVTNSGRSAGLSFANGLGTTAIGGSPGADGQWGGGGAVVSGNTPGNSATAPGAGGSGTATNASQASIAGGAGFDGFVSIYEYGSV